jgi:hypothetical protein
MIIKILYLFLRPSIDNYRSADIVVFDIQQSLCRTNWGIFVDLFVEFYIYLICQAIVNVFILLLVNVWYALLHLIAVILLYIYIDRVCPSVFAGKMCLLIVYNSFVILTFCSFWHEFYSKKWLDLKIITTFDTLQNLKSVHSKVTLLPRCKTNAAWNRFEWKNTSKFDKLIENF